MAKKKDFLQEKEKNLNFYKNAYANTVSNIESSINTLAYIIEGIDASIDAIDAYQEGLSATRRDLDKERTRNRTVLQNFKNLLCME